MSFIQLKGKNNKKNVDFTETCKVKIDSTKYQHSQYLYRTGLQNFSLFQKFSSFRWPAWVQALTDAGHNSAGIVPLVLINNSMRDGLYFTNFLSDEGIFIDPAGMISPSYENWSLEIWIVQGDRVIRAADDWKQVAVDRDVGNSVITVSWDNPLFKLTQAVYGARSTVDEAVIEIDCVLKEKKAASVMLTLRPYDQQRLGGVDSAEYVKDSRCITVNGRKLVCVQSAPDFTLAGGGEGGKDIDVAGTEGARSLSPFGLATIGLGYNLKKGDNRFVFRVALEKRGGISAGKYDFTSVKNDYISFASIRIKNGANVHLPVRLTQNWFYGSKVSLLNFSMQNLAGPEGAQTDFHKGFYAIFGLNRMGYFTESLKCIEHLVKGFHPDAKRVSFEDIINACYLLASIADYFTYIRDIDFIQSRFDFIRNTALIVFNYSKKMKKAGKTGRNSIRDYYIAEEHPHDLLLIAHALAQHSYMARCLGIFGEEIKYKKESERIANITVKAAFETRAEVADNDFIIHALFAGFPFRIESIHEDAMRLMMARVLAHFGGMPLLVKSLGWDVFSTLVAVNNLILMKDTKGLDVFNGLLNQRNRRYVLPEYLSPLTGRANWGEGVSLAVSSMIFATIRNLLFVDYPERLDLMPLPQPEWFQPGHEIRIDDMPSRFGLLTIRVVSTENEIQFHFDKLPKFVPPDVQINLPVKTRIKQEDDFILKREGATTFVINGWPSIIRFIRK